MEIENYALTFTSLGDVSIAEQLTFNRYNKINEVKNNGVDRYKKVN